MRPSLRSVWLPDWPPTWGDVFAAVGGAVLAAIELATAQAVAWPAVAVGAALPLVTLGPLSGPVRRVESWLQRLGSVGRVAVILGGVGAIALAGWLTDVPIAIVTGFVTGLMAGTALFVTVHVLAVREIDGWTR